MRSSTVSVLLVLATGCAAEPTGLAGGHGFTALVSETSTSTLIVFGDRAYADELVTIADGQVPLTFHWFSVEVAAASAPALQTPDGLVVDLAATAAEPVTFTQVYRDVCNPAANDFNGCWIVERYSAGDPGLTGALSVRLEADQAEGRFSLTWEGLTDRFGGQVQWHRHETSAGVVAAIQP